VTDLPTPVVCAHPSLTAGQRAAVASAFCAAHESGNALFTGFAAPDLDAIARFTEQCAAAQAHFGPELIAPRG
jgi:hypothetical protein